MEKFRRDGDVHFDAQCALGSELEGYIFGNGTVMPTPEYTMFVLFYNVVLSITTY